MRLPMLIGLTGRAGSGKDTIAAELIRSAWFERVGFADALKAAAYASDPYVSGTGGELGNRDGFRMIRLSQLVDLCGGWDTAKTDYPDVRRYLQRYGVALRDTLPGCWIDAAFRTINKHRADGRPVVVTDVRFPDEVAAIKAAGGAVIRLHRDELRDLGENAGHASEALVDSLEVDADVDNNTAYPALVAHRVLLAALSRPRPETENAR